MKFELPTKADQFFIESNEMDKNAAIRTGQRNLFVYSEGYKLAAKKLFEQIDGSAWNANLLVYPIVFNCRQHIELALKEIICGLSYYVKHEFEFPNGHDLIKLWQQFLLIDNNTGRTEEIEVDLKAAVEKLLKEFNDIDPGSYSFRYPVDSTSARNASHSLKIIDLRNFSEVFEKICNFLESEGERVYYLIDQTDEYISIMQSELAGSFY